MDDMDDIFRTGAFLIFRCQTQGMMKFRIVPNHRLLSVVGELVEVPDQIQHTVGVTAFEQAQGR